MIKNLNSGARAFQRGIKHGEYICKLRGKRVAKKIIKYKPQDDYEKGKINACKTYISKECWGNCKVCNKHEDLRYGVCFDCSDKVKIDKNGVCQDITTGKTWVVSEL